MALPSTQPPFSSAAIWLWVPGSGCPVCEALCPDGLADSQGPAFPTLSCSFLVMLWASVGKAMWPTLLFKLPLMSLPEGHLRNLGNLSIEARGLEDLGSSLESLPKAWGLIFSFRSGRMLAFGLCDFGPGDLTSLSL